MNGVKRIRFRVKSITRHFGSQDFWVNTVVRKASSDVYYEVLLVPIDKTYGLLDVSNLHIQTQFPMAIDQIVELEGGF